MRRAWLAELWIIGGVFAAAVAAGSLTGGVLWWVAGAGALYAVLNVRNAARHLGWLSRGLDDPPPEAFGLWAEVSHRLFQERREAREAAREAEAEVKEYERSVQALPDGIVVLDADLHIRWSNTAAQRLIGLRDPEDRGQHIDNLLRHPEFMDYRR